MHRALALVAASALAFPSAARAAELTDVASSFEEGNPFDFRFRVRYDNSSKTAQLKREISGLSSSQDAIGTYRDLVYKESKDVFTMRAELGLFHDLMLHIELPVILRMTEQYDFDQLASGSGCQFGGQMNPNCVNANNSTAIRDGILPAAGFDANNNGVGIAGGGKTIFRGVNRGATAGGGGDAFDTLNLGLTWAPLSQKRDATKPTWIIGIEGQISIGNIRKFDRANPGANHGVSEGVHRLLFKTAISRRTKYVEPYVGFHYMLPIARSGSLFVNYGRAQKTKNPQMSAGTVFGFEAIPYEHKSKEYKFLIDFRGRLEGKFDGRGYSEGFEMFASSPALGCDAAYNLACDASRIKNAYQGVPNTGLSVIENHAILGADIAIGGQISKWFALKAGFSYTWQQSHAITNDDVGKPLQGNGRVTLPEEFNPAYRPVVDQVGRRYRVENASTYNGWIWAQVMF